MAHFEIGYGMPITGTICVVGDHIVQMLIEARIVKCRNILHTAGLDAVILDMMLRSLKAMLQP